jgi:hypothetical protein
MGHGAEGLPPSGSLHQVMASLWTPRVQVTPSRVLHGSEYCVLLPGWALSGGPGVALAGALGPVRVPVGSPGQLGPPTPNVCAGARPLNSKPQGLFWPSMAYFVICKAERP